jgi:phytoene dehydrogenase-like protein
MRTHITVVGGGLAGLTAAIACAEHGATVDLLEAHTTLGGRARTTAGPYLANDGPHAFYSDGEPFRWLSLRRFVQPFTRPTVGNLAHAKFRHHGRLTTIPPAALVAMLAHRTTTAPVDRDFASWATERFSATAAAAACGFMGIVTYSADVGGLSAAFVWERLLRAGAAGLPVVRYPVGGWSSVIARMAAHAVSLGVRTTTGARVTQLPPSPVIVATPLGPARGLLDDSTLGWPSGNAVLLDLGLRADDNDPFLISDLDDGGFVERFSMLDPSLAPAGHSLVQAMMPVGTGETRAGAVTRLEAVVDLATPGWRERAGWRRETGARARTGALDPPGHTWRDRPAIDRGDGVWLVGDSVAAPGLLSEVSVNSALIAARAVLGAVETIA